MNINSFLRYKTQSIIYNIIVSTFFRYLSIVILMTFNVAYYSKNDYETCLSINTPLYSHNVLRTRKIWEYIALIDYISINNFSGVHVMKLFGRPSLQSANCRNIIRVTVIHTSTRESLLGPPKYCC